MSGKNHATFVDEIPPSQSASRAKAHLKPPRKPAVRRLRCYAEVLRRIRSSARNATDNRASLSLTIDQRVSTLHWKSDRSSVLTHSIRGNACNADVSRPNRKPYEDYVESGQKKYRARNKGMQILYSRTRARPDKAV